MRRWAWIVAAALVACREQDAPEVPAEPVSWSVVASIDKNEVQVGEDLTLTLTVIHPAGSDFAPPVESDLAPFALIDLTTVDVSPVERRLLYRIAAYQLPADLEIPALTVRHAGEDGEIETLETEPIPVRVVTSLAPDVTEIHDIKEPVALLVPRDWSLFGWLLLATVAALIAYLVYRKLRRKQEAVIAPAPAKPLLPPDVDAEQALERLAAKMLIEKGELSAFYTELSEIVRRYSGRRFEVPYLERTTSEILADLKSKRVAREPFEQLRAILDAADLVKFAKLVPERDEAEACFSLARQFLEETRLRPEPAMEATA